MIWNGEFLITATSKIDDLVKVKDTKLSEILFEEEVLQEIKIGNKNVTRFLTRKDILNELVDNITQITEEDCCDKSIYSRIHAAYVSCEILIACSYDLTHALVEDLDPLNKIISCLTHHNQRVVPQKATLVGKLINIVHSQAPAKLSCHITRNIDIFSALIRVLVENIDISGSYDILSTFINRTDQLEYRYIFCEVLGKFHLIFDLINVMTSSKHEDKQRNACQLLCDIIVIGRQLNSEQECFELPPQPDMLSELLESQDAVAYMLSHIFPSKTKQNGKGKEEDEHKEEVKIEEDVEIEEGVKIEEDVEIEEGVKIEEEVKTENDRKIEEEVETENDVKIEEEVETETENEVKTENDVKAEDDVKIEEDGTTSATSAPNLTAILCSLKVLQTLVEKKTINGSKDMDPFTNNYIARTVERLQNVLADNLINFHELLLNPPKQEPIKTTFGIIQKPLGYMRLEVVSLIRTLLSTNSPVITRKLVELNTMKVIIDLFIEYSWNNLLHTQVERALCLIIKNCRHDEDQRDMNDLSEENNANEKAASDDIPSRALLSQLLNECDLIGRLLLPSRKDEQANFGHIIQIINSIAINCNLDTIQDHLNEMRDKRQHLYDRWTSFVNVDVASFKEISLYCDVHTLNNHEKERDKQHHYLNPQQNHHPHNTLSNKSLSNNNGPSSNDTSENGNDRALLAYLSFTRETVIPSINVDVIPKSRRSTKTNNY